MEFIYIDLIILAIFSILVAIFLIRNRKKLIVESKIFLLYKTKVGIKFIQSVTNFLSPVMPVLVWVSISLGFLMMAAIVFLLVESLIILIQMSGTLSAPPLMPLLPYVPQAFDMGFPNLYFIYWIVAIVLLVTTHEASHGVFANFFKIKIKATGFGFLGPLLTAFVEPDEKVMRKRNAKQQLSIFAAGSFSNLVFGIIFLIFLQIFVILSFTSLGVGNYLFMYQPMNLSDIDNIGEYSPQAFLDLSDEELLDIKETFEINVEGEKYYLNPVLIKEIVRNKAKLEEEQAILVFQDTPAFRANLSGGIQKIGDYETKNIFDVTEALSKYDPGDKINVITTTGNYEIVLDESPYEQDKVFLGIAFPTSISLLDIISAPRFNAFGYFEPKYNINILNFIKDFLVWIVLIFILVALFNMLPLGFLDGGRFIYIFTFALTKSQKAATAIYKIFSSLILLIFFAMMLVWLIK